MHSWLDLITGKRKNINEIGASSRARKIEQNDYVHIQFVTTLSCFYYNKDSSLSINRIELTNLNIFFSTLVICSNI